MPISSSLLICFWIASASASAGRLALVLNSLSAMSNHLKRVKIVDNWYADLEMPCRRKTSVCGGGAFFGWRFLLRRSPEFPAS